MSLGDWGAIGSIVAAVIAVLAFGFTLYKALGVQELLADNLLLRVIVGIIVGVVVFFICGFALYVPYDNRFVWGWLFLRVWDDYSPVEPGLLIIYISILAGVSVAVFIWTRD